MCSCSCLWNSRIDTVPLSTHWQSHLLGLPFSLVSSHHTSLCRSAHLIIFDSIFIFHQFHIFKLYSLRYRSLLFLSLTFNFCIFLLLHSFCNKIHLPSVSQNINSSISFPNDLSSHALSTLTSNDCNNRFCSRDATIWTNGADRHRIQSLKSAFICKIS